MTGEVTKKRKISGTEASREKRIALLINQFQQDFSRLSVMSSIIGAWANSNKVSTRELERSERLRRAIAEAPAGALQSELLLSVGDLTLKDVEVAFENLIDAGRKRSEGVVYTPNYITDFLVKRCAEKRNDKSLPRFLDLACGGGGFVIRAIPILSEFYGVTPEKIIAECVYGMDINQDAIDCAQISLDLFCAERKLKNRSPQGVFLVGDSLLTPKKKICKLFGVPSGGFDLVTTNPPYVKLQNLDIDYRIKLAEEYPQFAIGSFSLAMLFLVAGHRMLSPSGVLGYITQNNLFTSLAGIGVRDYLQRAKCVHSIVDFEHCKVFNNASAYTCLIFLDNVERESFGYTTCSNPKQQLTHLKDKDFHPILMSGLRKEKWRLTAPHHLRNIAKLENSGTPLGELAEIRVGFATLKDSVFLLNGLSEHKKIEKKITVPAIKIAEFSNESDLRDNKRKIIRPYHKVGKRWIAYSEEELKKQFPIAFDYLEKHKDELNGRGKGKKLPKNFYEWGRSQCMEAPGPKLLTKTFSKGPQFLLDETDSLFCNGYSIRPKVTNDLFSPTMDIRLLQLLLNSRVMDYYTRLTAFQIEGGYQCFQKNFIEKFCIPSIAERDREKIMKLEGEKRELLICSVFGIDWSELTEIVPSS